MSEVTLYHGDCLDIMKDIPNHSIDAAIVDPPYGGTANEWDKPIDTELLFKQFKRVVKKKGNIVLFGKGMFAFELAVANKDIFRYDMVWKKSKCGSALTAKYMPLKKHELILVFGEPASYYYPQLVAGKPYKRKYTPIKTNNMNYGITGIEANNTGTRHPITVLDYPQLWRRQDQIHPTQKPVELMEWLVIAFCPKEGLILDCCMGSGTTGMACVRTNRNFIGIEIDQHYYDVAEKRIKEEQKEQQKIKKVDVSEKIFHNIQAI